MQYRLLDLIACPKCHGSFTAEPFGVATLPGWTDVDIVEGRLRCVNCGRTFPIINGVPRLLDPTLLKHMQLRYPAFFAQHREFLPSAHGSADGSPLADTLESFTRQRLDLRPPGPAFVSQWTAHLVRNLGAALRLSDLHDKIVLDVGCGFGRHLYVASEHGAETIGLDLSGGVDIARQNNLNHPRCHIVQANILDRPLHEAGFDVVWCFGVLHHMPEPGGGFAAIVPFAKRDGGLVVIWVYGYRGMAFTYRLSHMRFLRQFTRQMSGPTRVRISKMVAASLSGLYWEPLRLVRGVGLGGVVKRLPLTDHIDQDWSARVAAVHDRLSTPITHFHDREELIEWFRSADLTDVVVEDTNRRGWRACGRRSAETAPAHTAEASGVIATVS